MSVVGCFIYSLEHKLFVHAICVFMRVIDVAAAATVCVCAFPSETGRELANSWDCPFIEASAKDRINVNDVFASVVREMNMTSEKRQQKSYCCCTLL